MNWNLDSFYKGMNDPKYKNDETKLVDLIEKYNEIPNLFDKKEELDVILSYIKLEQEIVKIASTLFGYNSLVNATDVSNEETLQNMAKLSNILNERTKTDVQIVRYLEKIDLEKYRDNEIVLDNLFVLKEMQDSAKHLLSEKEEVLYSKISELSSDSWSLVQSLLTAKLDVLFDDKTITLSEVRNLAYNEDKEIRQKAYQSELNAYQKIEEMVSMALSNIKREVVIMNELRGYKDVFEDTLLSSRMSQETLKAMISAMEDYKVHFERYLLEKANYLGHNNGLPFYDLFAPIGSLTKSFTYEEAKDVIVSSFNSFSNKLANYAKKAFDNNWIDPFPKKGKVGGAFCSNHPQLKESRILSNFTGSLSDVSTLAHELGHGYHGEIIQNNTPLNWDYPMPLAETASIFCETIVTNHLLSELKDDKEILSVLEIALQGDTQVIIDILSRYKFEESIFKLATGPISSNQMKELMIQAQKDAYGNGLNHNFLHPYMWLNKGHYYSAGLNFYNFPYAFGLLFGKGLYAMYLKDPKTFVESYDELLKLTTSATVEDVAKTMNIDVTKKDFWNSSLELIKKDIDKVIELMNK